MAESPPPCSVVLEGGVTSAVIYATLLARLSRHYTFRQLGGASSGAVAATAAAAAEYTRQFAPAANPTRAFSLLSHFPNLLAEAKNKRDTTLFRLFQPQKKGLASFRVAMAALDRKGGGGLLVACARILLALAVHFWPLALFLSLPLAGIPYIVVSWFEGLGARWWSLIGVGVAATVTSALAVILVLVAWGFMVTLCALRRNHWGLCSGMTEHRFAPDQALTPTLHAFFQSLAGRKEDDPPLTFGDLWWGIQPSDPPKDAQLGTRRIDLQIITSSVCLARPMRLPGEPGSNPLQAYFYDPDEWDDLFPPDVMRHLYTHRRMAELPRQTGKPLLALPEPHHWPVLMAARLSLSFPLLLSAVPMYIAVPRREVLRAAQPGDTLPFEARKIYFSDGGITSNCPVHLFDAPLPGYPTFGINLYDRPRGKGVKVSRSDTHDPELDAALTPDAADWRSPIPFLLAILSTTLGWRDSLQRSLPGYRERMVHIGVPPEAGGLNLAMKPATILRLGTLGKLAARHLRRDFSTPRRPGEYNAWERHRWTRTRSTLTALHTYLRAFDNRLAAGEPDYGRLIRTARPERHPFDSETARQQAIDLADGVRQLIQTLESTHPSDAMDRGSPQPLPALHMSPPW